MTDEFINQASEQFHKQEKEQKHWDDKEVENYLKTKDYENEQVVQMAFGSLQDLLTHPKVNKDQQAIIYDLLELLKTL